MKPILAFLATLAVTLPAAAMTQPQDAPPAAPMAAPPGVLGDDDEAVLAGDGQRLVREARVVRRGVVVGPRGQVRTFTYRGRPLAVIRRPAFIYPPGYRYRRWVAGALLPAALIAAPFFFLDYQAAGLRPPPPEYRWVRYGPDLVLVNERTRRIEEVAYGAVEDE